MRVILAPILIAASLCGSASAVNYMTSTTNDAFVRSGVHADTTFNNNDLTVKDSNPANNFARKGYIQFDLSGLGPVPASGGFLKLVVASNNGGGNPQGPPQDFDLLVSTLNDADPGETWSESTLTFNNAPANDTASEDGFLAANSGAVTTYSIASSDVVNTTLMFPLSPGLLADVNGDSDGLITFLLGRDSSSGGHNLAFRSSEQGDGANAAMLILVPEPSRALLMAGGLLLMGLRRRR